LKSRHLLCKVTALQIPFCSNWNASALVPLFTASSKVLVEYQSKTDRGPGQQCAGFFESADFENFMKWFCGHKLNDIGWTLEQIDVEAVCKEGKKIISTSSRSPM